MTREEMSAQDVTSLTEKQHEILDYLWESVDDQTYFKSRYIADDLGFTAPEVGTNIARIIDHDVDLNIERWGGNGGIIWKVTKGGEADSRRS